MQNRIDCIAATASGLARDQFAQESKEPKAVATTRNRAIVSLKSFVDILFEFVAFFHIIDDYYVRRRPTSCRS